MNRRAPVLPPTLSQALLAGLLVACTAQPEDKMSTPSSDHRHPAGFVIPVPGGFGARETAQQLTLDEGGDVRSPRRLVFDLVPAVPPGLERSRPLGSAQVPYRVSVGPGGSGGEAYELEAARPWGERWLRLRASEQSERGEPDFAIAWRVLAGARRVQE